MVTFNPEEKRILSTLYAANQPLTTKDISERSEMAWATAKKYLERLYSKNVVDYGKYGKSVYWWLRV